MPTIHNQATINTHLQCLVAQDPRLLAVSQMAGALQPRMHPPGFEGLARVVCGQQLSVASAGAIWQRFMARGDAARSPQAYLAHCETGLDGVGLSRSKIQTLQGVAQAMTQGRLDLHAIAALPADQAVAALTQFKGIGPWTAEIYLMFCAGHPDVFPVGDLALRKSVGQALGLGPDVKPADLARVAAAWAPWRSVSALLFWRYYSVLNRKNALPV